MSETEGGGWVFIENTSQADSVWWPPVCRSVWLRTHARWHLVLHMAGCMSRTHAGRHHSSQMSGWNSCKVPHILTHVDHHASVACVATSRAWPLHLVLLCVSLHGLLPCTATPRASIDTQLSGQLTPRSEPMQRATSSFSVDLHDFGPSGEFSSRDQSRIFLRSRSDALNIFNRLLMNSDIP